MNGRRLARLIAALRLGSRAENRRISPSISWSTRFPTGRDCQGRAERAASGGRWPLTVSSGRKDLLPRDRRRDATESGDTAKRTMAYADAPGVREIGKVTAAILDFGGSRGQCCTSQHLGGMRGQDTTAGSEQRLKGPTGVVSRASGRQVASENDS